MLVAIVVARFNDFVTERLLDGARAALTDAGLGDGDVDVWRVPGAFEIPMAAQRVAESGKVSAVVCLGCLIRGATPHFEYIASEVAKGVATAGLESGVPIAFGVLTTDSIEQAVERAGTKAGNKGFDAACSAIEMVNLLRELK